MSACWHPGLYLAGDMLRCPDCRATFARATPEERLAEARALLRAKVPAGARPPAPTAPTLVPDLVATVDVDVEGEVL